MIETLGPIPYYLISAGKFSGNYFNKDGSLLKINNIKEYRIKDILTNEFKFDVKKAQEIEDFLLPMLEYDPKKRVDAKTALKSTWLWN